MLNLKEEKKDIGLLTKINLLILLVLTTCICSGQKLTSDYLTFVNQTDCSICFGKLAKQIVDPTEFATLRIDVLDFRSCRREKQLTKLQYHRTRDSVYYLNPGRMRRKCLRIRLFRSRSIIRSFLNQYKTGWTVQKQNWRIEYPLQNLREEN